MKFLELVKEGRNSTGLYLGGIALIISLYILGNIPMLLDVKYNFPGTLFDPAQTDFIAAYGSLRLLIGMLIPFILVFFGLVLYLMYAHKRGLKSIFTSVPRFRWKRFLGFSAFLLVFFGAYTFLDLVISGATDQLTWNFKAASFWPLLLVAFLMVPFQAAAEELIFRIYALQGLYLRTNNPWISLTISSLMFAFMHISNPEVNALGPGILLYYFMAGVFMALISIQDEGAELAIAFHVFNNLFGVLVLTSGWHVFRTDALFIDERPPGNLTIQLLSGALTFAFLYFVLAKKLGWKPLKSLR